jgi:hypothetical protein
VGGDRGDRECGGGDAGFSEAVQGVRTPVERPEC